jgi:hypothetical protein
VGYWSFGRLYLADKASFRRDKDKRSLSQGTLNVVLALRDKRRVERLDAPVVAMIEGVRVFGRSVDDMAVDDWSSRI